MKIKEISIGGSRTINLGNYNSIRVEGLCTVEVGEKEQDEKSLAAARDIAIQEVKTQLVAAYKALKPPEKT